MPDGEEASQLIEEQQSLGQRVQRLQRELEPRQQQLNKLTGERDELLKEYSEVTQPVEKARAQLLSIQAELNERVRELLSTAGGRTQAVRRTTAQRLDEMRAELRAEIEKWGDRVNSPEAKLALMPLRSTIRTLESQMEEAVPKIKTEGEQRLVQVQSERAKVEERIANLTGMLARFNEAIQ